MSKNKRNGLNKIMNIMKGCNISLDELADMCSDPHKDAPIEVESIDEAKRIMENTQPGGLKEALKEAVEKKEAIKEFGETVIKDSYDRVFAKVSENGEYVRMENLLFKYGYGTVNNVPTGTKAINLANIGGAKVKLSYDQNNGFNISATKSASEIVRGIFSSLSSGKTPADNIFAPLKARQRVNQDPSVTYCSEEVYEALEYIEDRYKEVWNDLVLRLFKEYDNGNGNVELKIPKILATLDLNDLGQNITTVGGFVNEIIANGLVKRVERVY